MLPSLRLPLRFDLAGLKADLAGILPDEWSPHYNERDYGGDWRGAALRSLGGDPRMLFAGAAGADGFVDTPILDRCPAVRQVLSHFDCPVKSVRLLSLAPGSFIREHRDVALGFEDGEVRIHVPVKTGPHVEFYSDGNRLLLEEGSSYYVNVSLPHRVNNRSSEERVHLVIDADVNDWVRRLFESSQPIPRIAPMAAGFAGFREIVVGDVAMQKRLAAIEEKDALIDEVMGLGRERGFDFHAEDIRPGTFSCAVPREWVPVKVQVQGAEIRAEWVYAGAARFTESFFDDTVQRLLRNPFAQAFRFDAPLADGDCNPHSSNTLLKNGFSLPLADARGPVTPSESEAPDGFIFHTSRCGSTLAAQVLAAPPENCVISEAPCIDEVIQTGRADWLRSVVGALRRSSGPYFVKLDSWHIHNLPLIRSAFPETRWVFLYRDPLEVMVSHRRSPGKQALPGALDPAQLRMRVEDITAVPRDEWFARVLEKIFVAALKHRDDPAGLFLNYNQLPEAVWEILPRHFGFGPMPEMQEAARLDAKDASRTFEPDSKGKQADAPERLRELAAELSPLYRLLLDCGRS